MTLDLDSVADLAAALAELTDTERGALEARMISVAHHFVDCGMQRPANVFHTLAVLVAEEGDRRAALTEHARSELNGDEIGALLAEDLESLRALTQPDEDKPA